MGIQFLVFSFQYNIYFKFPTILLLLAEESKASKGYAGSRTIDQTICGRVWLVHRKQKIVDVFCTSPHKIRSFCAWMLSYCCVCGR